MPFHRFTPPVIGDFSWVNQGAATVTERKGMAVLETPSVASGENLRCLVKSAPATPYEITIAMMAFGPIYTTSSAVPQFGFCCRESGSGKLLTYGFGFNSYPFRFQYAQFNSPTSLSGGVVDAPAVSHWPLWLRFSDDGTYRRVYVSGDGVKFNLAVGEESRTTFLTADEVGVFANSWKNTYVPRMSFRFCTGSGFGYNSYPSRFQYAQMTNPTTLATGGIVDVVAPQHWPRWLRVADDGTNRRVYVSGDGVKFNLAVDAESRTAFLTADEVGVFANSWKSTYVLRVISFLHWGEA